MYLPSKAIEPHAVLRVLLPANYPSGSGPVMELEAAEVPEQQLAAAVKHMEDMYTPGERRKGTAVHVAAAQLTFCDLRTLLQLVLLQAKAISSGCGWVLAREWGSHQSTWWASGMLHCSWFYTACKPARADLAYNPAPLPLAAPVQDRCASLTV